MLGSWKITMATDPSVKSLCRPVACATTPNRTIRPQIPRKKRFFRSHIGPEILRNIFTCDNAICHPRTGYAYTEVTAVYGTNAVTATGRRFPWR